MSGCLGEFLLNGEQQPVDGATDRFDVQQVGEVLYECDVVTAPFRTPLPYQAGDGDAWKLPVIIVSAIVGVCLVVLVILLVVYCVHRRRTRVGKGEFNPWTSIELHTISAPHAHFVRLGS